MIYLQKSKNKRSPRFLILLIAVALLLVLDFSGVFKKTFETFSSSAWQNADSFNSFILRFAGSFAEKQSLLAENEALRSELADMKLSEGLASSTGAIGLPASDGSGENAEVIAKFPFTGFGKILVRPDADSFSDRADWTGRLVSKGGHFVGRVESASGMVLSVSVFGEAGREYELYLGEKMLPISAVGEGAGAFSFKLSKSETVSEGDPLYIFAGKSSGDKIVDSKKLIAGEVAGISNDSSDPIQNISGRASVNTLELSRVFLSPDYFVK